MERDAPSSRAGLVDQLEPGDRVVIVTDGTLERRAAALPLTALLEQTRTSHPPEATRRLADTVLEVAGPQIADDATILMLDCTAKRSASATAAPAPTTTNERG